MWEEYNDIPRGLREGFFLGLENVTLAKTFIPPNHCTDERHLQIIRDQYAAEEALGRISKGYAPEELESLIGEIFA